MNKFIIGCMALAMISTGSVYATGKKGKKAKAECQKACPEKKDCSKKANCTSMPGCVCH